MKFLVSGAMKSGVDLIATVAMATAAVVLVWRGVSGPSPVDAGPPSSERRGRPMESIEAAQLVTSLSDAPKLGQKDASVVLIEFGDFECPFCGRYARDTFEKVVREFVERGFVQYVFRHFPLEDSHKNALVAAQAAECALVQGKFWEMRRYLFGNQAALGADGVLSRGASAVGLNGSSFQDCLRGDTIGRIRSDVTEGRRLGVASTPTFFVGNVESGKVRLIGRIKGAQPYNVFEAAMRGVMAAGANSTAPK